MATPRTHRLIEVADASRQLNTAIGARRRLQEEAIGLNRQISAAQARIVEIDSEEEILSAAIDTHGATVAKANAEPPGEPSEAEVSGSHP